MSAIDGIISRIAGPGLTLTPLRKRLVLCAAAALFAVGAGLSVYSQPGILDGLTWGAVAGVAAVGVPLAICLNAVEFQLTGRIVNQSIPFARSLEVTVLGTAANMLPLPGGTIVRVASLKAGGSRYRDGTMAVLYAAAAWAAVSFVFAGGGLLWLGRTVEGAGFLVTGLGTTVIVALLAARISGYAGSCAGIVAVKVALVGTDLLRLYLCFMALGIAVSPAQVLPIAASSVLGSAASIVPAGLGVREALAAAISPVVGLSVAVGFLAVTLNRLIETVCVIPLAIAMARLRRSGDSTDSPPVQMAETAALESAGRSSNRSIHAEL